MGRQGLSVDISVDGLDRAMRGLREVNRDLYREMRRGLKEDARPVLEDARSYASGLGGSGDYAGSLVIRAISNGVRVQSDDPGAGTIEFANRGAVYLSGRRRGLPVGVPMGSPPRALVRAAEEDEPLVRRAVEDRIARIIDGRMHG